MIAAYSPPPHVQGDEDNRQLLLALIAQAAVESVPADWSADRINVYGQNLWKAIVGAKYGAHWPLVDQVAKHANATVAEMERGELPSGREQLASPVRRDFPGFYARMAATMARPIEDSRYMQERKAEWCRVYGRWPLDQTDPDMGTAPDFPSFYSRMLYEHPNMMPGLRKILESARDKWGARFGPWQQAAE